MITIAKQFADKYSHDPRTKVGCMLVVGDVEFIGTNQMPETMMWTPEMLQDRTWKNQHMVHAEVNAILAAGNCENGIAYVTHHPCKGCAQKLVDAGIAMVIVPDVPANEGWEQSQKEAADVLVAGGVILIKQ